ncbi:MAG: SWIM zinc finger family protein [Deltaproteobacteria bacterium]|nr:SWIM zinc finger family protein [Deltaproteobacteria bacterium]MBN2844658.1 SWIM zinc finger family protein [Deltaproteobacteria bacterium]
MGNLKDWDFGNTELNSKQQLINRQKSALNVSVVALDTESKEGVFYDPKNGSVRANLSACECYDFKYVGKSPRKKFTPCMHIYRLAIELGMMKVRYYDKKALESLSVLQALPRDLSKWGKWNQIIHKARLQIDRQFRAYGIVDDNQIVDTRTKSGIINGYETTLDHCTCPDFEERKLPCKHIYCLAILTGLSLELDREEYQRRKEEYEREFTPFITVRANINKRQVVASALRKGLAKLFDKK